MSALNPKFLWSVLSKLLRVNLREVSLQEGLTGKHKIPHYTLHEFHNLPGGYYSNTLTRGYGTGFNFFMLGEMKRIRKGIARELSSCKRVLDIGCGEGSSTDALCDEGIEDVWGLDPSPYMIIQAIEKNTPAKFVQGVAESTEFPDSSFDGISACWVFHEVPAQFSDAILKECHRLLKPGGKLVILEPSRLHTKKSYFYILKYLGLKGLYFRLLANFVYEPYLEEWLGKEIKPWVQSHGFELASNFNGVPEEKIVALKRTV